MFFYLSKILLFLIKPLVWIVLIYLRSIFTKDESKRKLRLIIATILLFLCSNNFLVNELAMLYEKNTSNNTNQKYDVGIVLGGFAGQESQSKQIEFYKSNDRLLQAIALLKQGTINRIMISSGAKNKAISDIPEADLVKTYLLSIGIADSLILTENKSRNTLENAEYSYQLLDSLGIENTPLIITSAWHVPRAKLCFNAKNREAHFFATNYMRSNIRDISIENLLLPSSNALGNLELLIKEWVGYMVYLVKL